MALPLVYNWRNLWTRRVSTGLTLLLVAVVVFVLALLLSFAAGIQASLNASGSDLNVIVLKPGATAESTSLITYEEAARLVQTPGLAHAADGAQLLSQELSVQTLIPRRRGGAPANVAIRGIDEMAPAVHPEVHLIAGRWCAPGTTEAIVGKAARDRYQNLDVGGEIPLGRKSDRPYTVVGVFEAGGGALESEVWAPRTMVSDAFQRRLVSSVYLRFVQPAEVAAAIAYIRGSAVSLDAKRETQYYADLSAKTREIVLLTSVLVGLMAIGAVFAVANTMYSAVDGRRRELAMLRALGFGRGAIMLSLVVESLIICGTACAAGLAASSLINGLRQDFLSDTTWTVLAYELRITPGIVGAALGLALLVGVAGALAPAIRAARLNVLLALRKA
jgi:putative ABC transport system permease protein